MEPLELSSLPALFRKVLAILTAIVCGAGKRLPGIDRVELRVGLLLACSFSTLESSWQSSWWSKGNYQVLDVVGMEMLGWWYQIYETTSP